MNLPAIGCNYANVSGNKRICPRKKSLSLVFSLETERNKEGERKGSLFLTEVPCTMWHVPRTWHQFIYRLMQMPYNVYTEHLASGQVDLSNCLSRRKVISSSGDVVNIGKG